MHRIFAPLVALAAALLTLANAGAAPNYAIGIYGPEDVKLKEDQPWPYVNPDAPKGGNLNMRSRTFTKLNPYSLKGVPAPLVDLIFESPTVSSAADNEPGTAYGLLVSSIDLAADRLSMVYKIRPEAAFSDGTPVTADDFVFSFEIMKDPEFNPFYRQYYSDIKSVTKVDAHTVRYDFARRNQELPLITGEMPILPKHVYGAPGKSFGKDFDVVAVGSGPYVIDRFEFNKFITVRRNPNWWGRNLAKNRGCHNFETITAKVYMDEVPMKEAFKGGEFDVLMPSSSKDWATDFKGPYVQKNYILRRELPQSRPVNMQGYVFNVRRPIFQSLKTRYALAMVFDFAWSNDNLFFKQYTRTRCFFENSPDLTNVAPPTGKLKDYLTELRTRFGVVAVPKAALDQPLDAPGAGLSPDEAMRQAEILLDSVGWKKGPDGIRRQGDQKLAFELLLSEELWQRVSEPYQQRLKQLGAQMTIKALQPAEYEKRERAFDYDMVVTVYGSGRSPGNELISSFGGKEADVPGSANLMGLKNPAVDEILQRIVQAQSRQDLAFNCQALDHVLTSSVLVVPHWHITRDRTLVWSRFSGPALNCSQKYFETAVRDYWWYDDAKDAQLQAAMAKGEALPAAP